MSKYALIQTYPETKLLATNLVLENLESVQNNILKEHKNTLQHITLGIYQCISKASAKAEVVTTIEEVKDTL